MDLTSILVIIGAIVIIYLFIKLVLSPLLKVILGVVFFLLLIYILQKFFGFDISRIFGPFGKYFSSAKVGSNFNWFLDPINYYTNKAVPFVNFIKKGIPNIPRSITIKIW